MPKERSNPHPDGRVAMDESPDQLSLEENRFTRTPDGWRFNAPILWPAGGRVYLVNDAQKAELLRRLELSSRWINRLCFPLIALMIVGQVKSCDPVEALSPAIGIDSRAVAAVIYALPLVLIFIGTPALQLLAIRSILVGAAAAPTRVGLWERLLATPESLARASSYFGLILLLLICTVYGGLLCYSVLTSHEADWPLLLPFTIGAGMILYAIAAVAALLFKLSAGRSEQGEG
jgi:hypothetical protein